MFKFIASLLILSISLTYVASQNGNAYDTQAQCVSACKDNNPCNTKQCLYYYSWFCSINPTNCEDSNVCTIDTCNSSGSCVHTPINCDDNNPCTYDYCHASLGCIHVTQDCDVVVPCNTTSNCYRGKKCETYTCVSGRCDYDPVPCSIYTPCSESTGACVNVPTN